jgi:hypothetical protein
MATELKTQPRLFKNCRNENLGLIAIVDFENTIAKPK